MAVRSKKNVKKSAKLGRSRTSQPDASVKVFAKKILPRIER